MQFHIALLKVAFLKIVFLGQFLSQFVHIQYALVYIYLKVGLQSTFKSDFFPLVENSEHFTGGR
jgi:hypothetical protein